MSDELPLPDARTTAPVKALTDDDWIPLGKYAPGRGDQRKLKDVPPSYLLWLWDERLHRENTPLALYVKSAYKALQVDASDYISKYDRDGKRIGR